MSIKNKIVRILYYTFVALILLFAIWGVYFITSNSSRLDFRVFYGAGIAAIKGKSIYTLYGIYTMPFWYFPWVAWMFIPFAALTFSQAWYVYVILCCVLLWGILNYFADVFHVTQQMADKTFLYGMSLLLCLMLFNFGQTNILVLALATLEVELLERKKYLAAGVLLPFVLMKPHLLLVFVIACLLKGGKHTFAGASIASLGMFTIESVLDPGWGNDLLNVFTYGSHRNDKLHWGHTTLPRLLGFPENFVGTANVPIIGLSILVGILVIWRFRKIPAPQLIAISLAASLFCAPRAFGYDLILLFPAMLLISENFDWKILSFWILAILIPFAFNFSTGSYILTLLVCGLSIWKLWVGSAQLGIAPVQSTAG